MTTYSRLENPRGKYPYIILDGCKGRDIIFRNLSGGPTVFNPQNKDRTFGVVIDDEDFAKSLEREGWRIKWFEPKHDGDERRAYLIVKAQFKPVVPKIYIEKSKGKYVRMTEETIGVLDDSDIISVKLAINGRQIFPKGKGDPYPKAYVSEMVVELAPSIFGITETSDDYPEEKSLDIADDDLPY